MSKKMKNAEIESRLPNMIGSGTKIVGNIETNGDIRIEGKIEGNMNAKGKVVVGNNGCVKGGIIVAYHYLPLRINIALDVAIDANVSIGFDIAHNFGSGTNHIGQSALDFSVFHLLAHYSLKLSLLAKKQM